MSSDASSAGEPKPAAEAEGQPEREPAGAAEGAAGLEGEAGEAWATGAGFELPPMDTAQPAAERPGGDGAGVGAAEGRQGGVARDDIRSHSGSDPGDDAKSDVHSTGAVATGAPGDELERGVLGLGDRTAG